MGAVSLGKLEVAKETRASHVVGERRRVGFLWLVLSWKKEQRLGKLSIKSWPFGADCHRGCGGLPGLVAAGFGSEIRVLFHTWPGHWLFVCSVSLLTDLNVCTAWAPKLLLPLRQLCLEQTVVLR